MSDHVERLALPSPENANEDKKDLEPGSTIKMDNLGPMVVNSDGTLSRIANWQEMSDIERVRTLKVLLKRNQIRLETIAAAEASKGEAVGDGNSNNEVE
ncbi:hypothetical protein FRC17_006849 [Serendipita sp. 399]|nr:hypothetical protein FRC17_006849 [Serendipita sp. 399]